jgi:hypothetical protein
MKLRIALLPFAVLSMVVPSLMGAPASAAADTQPPTLDLPTRGSFVLLSSISATSTDPFAGTPLETSVAMTAQWSATDASGICGYSTREVYDEYSAEWSTWTSETSVQRTVTDYDDQEGGGSDKFWGYDVRAQDCAGNVTQKFVRLAPAVYQQDGQSYGYGTLDLNISGRWKTTNCACWSAGTALRTSSKGARIDFHISAEPVGIFDPATTFPIALVMERAPDRGKARVLIDGVKVATIDTGATTKLHRSIVWTGRIRAGTHTLSVVNLATAGRPRIDIDAVVSTESAANGGPV